jgi:hypothetical protein
LKIISLTITNLEACLLALKIAQLNLYPLHPGTRRPPVTPGHHFFHPGFFPLEISLHLPVPAVPDPAGQPQQAGFIAGVSPEIDPLDPAMDDDVSGYFFQDTFLQNNN